MSLAYMPSFEPTLTCYLTDKALDISPDSLEYLVFSLEAGITAACRFYAKNPDGILDAELTEYLSEGYNPEEFQRGIWLYESQAGK